MKLSEAIRLGAALKPQAFGHAYSGARSCALGAAADAMGIDYYKTNWAAVLSGFTGEYHCPVAGCVDSGWMKYVGLIITHLNDNHRWTRERIADWVESLETQSPAGEKASLEPEAVGREEQEVGG